MYPIKILTEELVLELRLMSMRMLYLLHQFSLDVLGNPHPPKNPAPFSFAKPRDANSKSNVALSQHEVVDNMYKFSWYLLSKNNCLGIQQKTDRRRGGVYENHSNRQHNFNIFLLVVPLFQFPVLPPPPIGYATIKSIVIMISYFNYEKYLKAWDLTWQFVLALLKSTFSCYIWHFFFLQTFAQKTIASGNLRTVIIENKYQKRNFILSYCPCGDGWGTKRTSWACLKSCSKLLNRDTYSCLCGQRALRTQAGLVSSDGKRRLERGPWSIHWVCYGTGGYVRLKWHGTIEGTREGQTVLHLCSLTVDLSWKISRVTIMLR